MRVVTEWNHLGNKMRNGDPNSNENLDDVSANLDAIAKKWKALRFMGKVSIMVGVVLFSVLLYLGPQNSPLLLDISIWLLLGGFVLYVVGRLGSW